jgi:methylmalonyl-CoA/ethylmalonyl-CoA epimerase
MIQAIDHLGIAVKDIDAAMELYTNLLGVQSWHREQVLDQGVDVASCVVGNVRIELTAATRPDSPIAKFIEKRGEGIHHVAFRTDNIQHDLDEASERGFRLIDSHPRQGAHNMMIAFLHPASTGGVLMEFCAENPAP